MRFALGLIAVWLGGCTAVDVPFLLSKEKPVAALEEEAGASEGTMSGEIELPPLPTHWMAEEPVGAGAGPVTAEDLEHPFRSRDRWLHYGGTYDGFRHSPLEQLTPKAVADLRVAWAFPTGTTGQFEVSPIVYDGVMYVTSSYNRIFALDATSGDLLWRYDHVQPEDLRLCCGPPNRGAAIAGDLVLMATLDAKLLAFDRKTGAIAWQREIAPYARGYSATSAPLVVRNLAIIGVAGGEYGIRGFFDAYDVTTGERVWRHYTVPAAGEPGVETWAGDSYERGGSPAWTTGTYDPVTDTLFWTTGNPSPDWDGSVREGDNLYSDSLLALDPATGERKWHFQFTPHDVWDYDGNTHVFLLDVTIDGEKIPAVAQPNRNGYFYLIDRRDGSFLRATPYLEQVNWATIDEKGRPVVNPEALPQFEPAHRTCPGNMGGINGAWTASYHPGLGIAYVPSIEACQIFAKGESIFIPGFPYLGGIPDTVDAAQDLSYGNLVAVDVATGEIRWRHRDENPMMAGALTTAGGVVFTGNLEGDAIALDAKTGEEAWRFRMGGSVRSQPIAYEIDGRTYVAFGSGSWASIDVFSGGTDKIPEGGHLFVFVLPKP